LVLLLLHLLLLLLQVMEIQCEVSLFYH